jgi:hypothetical protein
MRERGLWAGLSNVLRIEFSPINASIMLGAFGDSDVPQANMATTSFTPVRSEGDLAHIAMRVLSSIALCLSSQTNLAKKLPDCDDGVPEVMTGGGT